MKSEKPSFEKDLWGQYNKLHERLKKKKAYIKNLLKSLETIYDTLKDLGKKLDSFKISSDPTISESLFESSESTESKEEKLYGISLTINNYMKFFQSLIDYNNQTFFHITKGLEDLLKKMEAEKDEYNNFIKCLKSLSDNKIIMDKNMKLYHQKMSAAENTVRDLKDFEVKKLKINNDPSNISNKNKLEEQANQLTNDCVKPFNIYSESVDKVNEIRVESIEMQKTLLFKYQNIEEESGKTNTSFAKIILLTYENINKELVETYIDAIKTIIKNINVNKDIKRLIIDNKGNEKPEEEILFTHFPSVIKFNESDDNKTYEIFKQTIEFIKGIIADEYPNYNEQLEKNKNDLRELLNKLFAKYDQEIAKKIMEYIKDAEIHKYFLIVLSKLRTNNRYEQNKTMIDFLGKILNIILDESEKTNNFDNAKNCIILSQTFYYENNGKKYYILEIIKKHKWLSKPEYWVKYIDIMLEPEFIKLVKRYPEITIEDIVNHTEKITNNFKKKLSDILYSQLLPFVNNMKEFEINQKKIVEITGDILSKYDFLSEEEKNNVFSLISEDQEEVNKILEDYKKNTDINNNEKNEINNNIKENNEIDKEKESKIDNNKNIETITNKEKKDNINNNNKNSKDKNVIENEKDSKNNTKKIEEKNVDINKKTNNEVEKKLNHNINNKNNINISKNAQKEKEKENENQELAFLSRSSTIDLGYLKKNEKNDKIQNENKISGIFNNIKNKFVNKEQKNKENEDKKENKKMDKKDVNTDKQNQIKKDLGNKMIRMNFEPNKLMLKPIPKNDNNNKSNKNDNNIKQTNNTSNPFGVVLKKIDKGKNGK